MHFGDGVAGTHAGMTWKEPVYGEGNPRVSAEVEERWAWGACAHVVEVVVVVVEVVAIAVERGGGS